MTTKQGERRQILLVEDDASVRDCLVEMLRSDGYRVTTAADGEEALDRLRARPLPSLILLDIMMPRMDGWQLRNELLKDPELGAIPVVVTSAISSAYNLKGHLHSVAYLEKPFDREQLLEVVRKYAT